MTTLNQAIEELRNQWHDIFFQDGDWVSITKDKVVVVSAEMHNINDEEEVVEFIEAFLDGSI